MFYATELFDVLGDGANSALLDTAIVGAVNVGSTILAIVLVDRYAVLSAYSRTACNALPLHLIVQLLHCSQCIAISALQSVQLLHCSLRSASIAVTAFPCFGQTVC